ncbi:ABC transporter substrate-binding protein [Ruania alba]|uniref:Carbohydrate ABC transporter substrate-binding protein, CUT1 family n=1 Tax=Ruania alba TaxID=648782 RepID=A0A1H5MYN0_9MICO|nr:sugar ABC transporter substrate-binding protein [Ruania alba]SEE93518.1 carbohydrate ABC transporter substrate-binding protein, CUT1 family [Ruania alba]
MKRYARISAAVLVGTLGLSACSGGDDDDVTTSLTFSMWAGSTPETEALQTLIDLVEEEHPDLSIELQTAPFNDYWTRLAAQASGGTEACILGVQSPRTSSISSLLLPLEDSALDTAGIDLSEFDDAIVEGTQVENVQYAVPYDVGPLVVFYNADAFAAADVVEPANGWTVEDFSSAAADLSADDGHGFAVTPNYDVTNAWSLTLGGEQGVAEDGSLQLDDPALVEAVEFLQQLIADGHAPPLAATSDNYNALNSFVSGDAAMVVDGPWQIAYVTEQVSFELGVAVMPAGPQGSATPVAGSGYGVSASCEYPEEALRAISVLTGPEAQTVLAEMGRAYPARIAEQPAYFQGAFQVAEGALAASSEGGQALRSTVNFTQVNSLFNQYAVSSFNGDMTAEDFLGTVQSQTEAGAQQ